MNGEPNPLEKLSVEWAIIIAATVGMMATIGRILQRRPSIPYTVAVGMCLSSVAASVTATLIGLEYGREHGRAWTILVGIIGGVMGMALFDLLAKLFIAVANQKINIVLEEQPKPDDK